MVCTRLLLCAALMLVINPVFAGVRTDIETGTIATLTVGAGPQPGAKQNNRTLGLDLNLWRFERSARQQLSLGVSYTYLGTSASTNRHLHAFSVYPQLTLRPTVDGWVNHLLPSQFRPYFFVRALGPSYISDNYLGERQQADHFAFQAQVGAGVSFTSRGGRAQHLSLSWKHFSNANLFSDNDGIEVPLVLSFGASF